MESLCILEKFVMINDREQCRLSLRRLRIVCYMRLMSYKDIKVSKRLGVGYNPDAIGWIWKMTCDFTLASFVLDDSSARPVVAGNVSGVRPVIPSALVTASEEWSKEDIRLRQDEGDVIRLVKERLRDQQPFGRAAMRDPLFRPYRKLWSVLFLDDSDLLVCMVKYLPEDEKSYVPVIPESLRKPLLYKFHDLGGHFV
ncbi:hypothetical protein FOZ61_002252 [Perkinsus olseni]|uniref:Uncharacterized protein n=1 Tax=Perkinsus olseni TaxID=32597 RepID=A0A7J6KPJ3_PEROL|nr:hypothetical protein FOZ61_002252 [Perkinsus olseni]